MIVKRGKSAYQRSEGAYRRIGFTTLIMGIVFFAIGIFPILTGHGYRTTLVAVLGLIFIVSSYFSFVNAKQISNIKE